jgi:hypothetical protein
MFMLQLFDGFFCLFFLKLSHGEIFAKRFGVLGFNFFVDRGNISFVVLFSFFSSLKFDCNRVDFAFGAFLPSNLFFFCDFLFSSYMLAKNGDVPRPNRMSATDISSSLSFRSLGKFLNEKI